MRLLAKSPTKTAWDPSRLGLVMSAAEDQAEEVAGMSVGVAAGGSVGFDRGLGDVGMVPGTEGSSVHRRHCHY